MSGPRSRSGFLEEAGVAVVEQAERDRFVAGLTMAAIVERASPRAKLGDVSEPRIAGESRQDSRRMYTFQLDSRRDQLEFYTVSVSIEERENFDETVVDASCSCPFKTNSGWCKHVVKCMETLVDPSRRKRSHDDDDDDDDERRRRRRIPDVVAAEDKKNEPLCNAPVPAKRDAAIRSCARCGATFTGESRCAMAHPKASVVDGKCFRCGRLVADESFCFLGHHESALAAVDAENWPTSDDDS